MYSDEQLAQVVHEVNRVMQAQAGDDMPSLPWYWEPRRNRRVTADAVRALRANPEMTAEDHHEAWFRLMTGRWWTLGEKDPERMTHPDIVHWGELSRAKRDRAELFTAVVRVLTREEVRNGDAENQAGS